MKAYAGRDRTRALRSSPGGPSASAREPWLEITDDDVHAGLEQLRSEPPRVYMGHDDQGRKVHHWKRKPKSAGDHQPLPRGAHGALHLGDQEARAPRGWETPRSKIERTPEKNGRARFLTPEERERLLEACRASAWRRLYLLVLMAITTGARRGELLALTWGDINLERRIAHVRDSKNGEPRVLPLVPAAVVDELARFQLERRRRARLPVEDEEQRAARSSSPPGSRRSRTRDRASASTTCATPSPPTSPRRARASSRSPRPWATASSRW
jgi:hypothetical protein